MPPAAEHLIASGEPKTSPFPAIASWLRRARGHFFPEFCAICGRPAPDPETRICEECLRRLPFNPSPNCPGCGGALDGIFELCRYCLSEEKRPWARAVSPLRMDGLAREMVHRLKYAGETEQARSFGALAARAWLEAGLKADLVTPVPLHWTRRFSRGYNQSALAADFFARKIGAPCRELLRRVRSGAPQASLSLTARRQNLLGAFRVRDRKMVRGRAIVLVDDVLTTGSTLRAAALVLRDADAEKIYVLALTRRY